MFKEKKAQTFCIFQLFQPLALIGVISHQLIYKTLKHSISYNTFHWSGPKKGEMRFQKPYTRFSCSNISL